MLNIRFDIIIKFKVICIFIFKDNIGIGLVYDIIFFLYDVIKWCDYWMNALFVRIYYVVLVYWV